MKTNDRAHVDKRITSTRNTILDAAISLYRKLGIEKTSISQVIDLSEVGRSTFYRHCSGRDDLLNQVLNRDFDAGMPICEQMLRVIRRANRGGHALVP
jgi:AcrR family transcriptional regulator